jgi:hypothetical protein
VTLYHLCWKAMQKRCLIHPNITKLWVENVFDFFTIRFLFDSTVKLQADQVVDVLTERPFLAPKHIMGLLNYKEKQYVLSKDLPSGKIYILRRFTARK